MNVTGLTTQQGVAYRQIGVVMRVTPHHADGKVIMRIEPQISSVSPTAVSLGNGLSAPAFNIQTVQTTVLASDGETIVLGGLITKQDNRNENGWPIFKDIPYVGALFRFRSQQIQKREVMIIMTPRIIRSEADQARILAEESAKMNWCLEDVARVHGHGMEVMGPAAHGAQVMPTNPNVPPGGYYQPGPAYFGGIAPEAGANPSLVAQPQPGMLPPQAQPYYPGVAGPFVPPMTGAAPPAASAPTAPAPAAPGPMPAQPQPAATAPTAPVSAMPNTPIIRRPL